MLFSLPLSLLAAATVLAAAPELQPQPSGPFGDGPSGLNQRLKNPLAEKAFENKQQALQRRLEAATNGKPSNTNKIEEVAKGQFVQMAVSDTDNVWTLLGEFSDYKHNEMPEPPMEDNVDKWEPDFSRDYYQGLLFGDEPGTETMTNYFLEQSGGRYMVEGTVEEWVELPGTRSDYGNDYCGGVVCTNVWSFVCNTANQWYEGQIVEGKTLSQIQSYLSAFDTWDRYDYDNDGDFDEPDGYIDHMQFVHASYGQESSGDEDDIWSHRWYVLFNLDGIAGPSLYAPQGGCEIGDSDYWIGDYTINPENGGLGVFSHEYAHDLGLPDLYSYEGQDNSVGFWDLMSSGGWLGKGVEDIGSNPGPMGAWEKLQLGWLDYEVVEYQEEKSIRLGPLTSASKAAQAVLLKLPNKIVYTPGVEAPSGDYMHYSGSGNDIDNTMSLIVNVPNGSPTLTAQVNYEIELDWDYAYLEVDGVPIETSESTTFDPFGSNAGFGITGTSGGWATLTADLTSFAGQTVELTFRYWTDAYVEERGLFVDDIYIGGVLLDDAETPGSPAWTFDGFYRKEGTLVETEEFFNAYLAEYRTYRGSDKNTESGPYSFVGDNYVEHFAYQDGLLVWYWDRSFTDNEVYSHCQAGRCGGLILPVDAHPNLIISSYFGQYNFGLGGRIQSFDSTFSLEPTDSFCLENWWGDENFCFGGDPANPLFDDTQNYLNPYYPSFNWIGVDVPKTGTTIKVVNTNAHKNFMQIHVNK